VGVFGRPRRTFQTERASSSCVCACPPSASGISLARGVCPGLSIHERVRKAHFGAVDGAIAGALEDGKQAMVLGVEDDALGGGLVSRQGQKRALVVSTASRSGLGLQIAP